MLVLVRRLLRSLFVSSCSSIFVWSWVFTATSSSLRDWSSSREVSSSSFAAWSSSFEEWSSSLRLLSCSMLLWRLSLVAESSLSSWRVAVSSTEEPSGEPASSTMPPFSLKVARKTFSLSFEMRMATCLFRPDGDGFHLLGGSVERGTHPVVEVLRKKIEEVLGRGPVGLAQVPVGGACVEYDVEGLGDRDCGGGKFFEEGLVDVLGE